MNFLINNWDSIITILNAIGIVLLSSKKANK